MGMHPTRFLSLLCLASSGCIASLHGQANVRAGGASGRVQASGGAADVALALLGVADALADEEAAGKVVANNAGASGASAGGDHETSGGGAGVTVVESGAAGGATIVESGAAAAGASGAMATGGGASGSGSAGSSGGASGSGATATGGGASGSGSAGSSGASGTGGAATAEPPQVDLFARGTATGHGRTLGALTGDGVTIRGHVTALAELAPLADTAYAAARGTGGSVAGGSVAAGLVVQTSIARNADGPPQVVVHLHGAGGGMTGEVRVRFHVVLDRSASMGSQWGRTVEAVADLIRALPPSAELQIVAYGDHAETVFGPARVSDANAVIAALDRIEPVGGSNVEAGLRAAYAVSLTDTGSHVVLVSDGVPSGGASTPAALGAIVGGALAHDGCTTSVVAIGANVDANVLRAIAGAGDGTFVLASSVSLLGAAIARDLRAHADVAASKVDVHVRLPVGVRFAAAAGDAAGTADFHVVFPRLAPGEDRTLVLPLDGRSSASAEVAVAWKVGASTRDAHADATLSLRAEPDAAAVLALLDAQLGGALQAAGQAIVAGDTGAATIALRAYAHAAAAAPTTDARVVARTDAVARIADAVATLGPAASWSDRRLTGNAMVALAWGFGD